MGLQQLFRHGRGHSQRNGEGARGGQAAGHHVLRAGEYNQIETVSASLDTYIASSEYDFIKGNKYATSDADWNDYLRKLEQYNYQTLLKCYNDAYSRLNS